MSILYSLIRNCKCLNFFFSSRKSVALHFNGQRSPWKMFGAGNVCESSLCTLMTWFASVLGVRVTTAVTDTLTRYEKAVKRKLF